MSSGFYGTVLVPNAFVVPYGSTTGTFTVTTSAMNVIAPITVTASYNGITLNSTLIVVPPGTQLAPASLSFSPPTVSSGATATGTVILTGSAPGGTSLYVSSDNPLVQVSPVVDIPAGATTIQFAANTSFVSSVDTATVTVSYGGVSQSCLLTLEPPSKATGSPSPLLTPPLMPVSQIPGGAGLTVTVYGTGFVPGAKVLWDATPLNTTYVNGARLQATVPNSDVTINRTAAVSVANPGAASATSNFLPEHLTYPSGASTFDISNLLITGQPAMVAAADFNHDGKLDLAIAKYDGSGVSVLLGNGDGTFDPEMLLSASGQTIAIGDLNGDGKPDIAAVNTSSGGVRIFLGNGDGRLTRMPDVAVSNCVNAYSVALADLNGDGSLDLVLPGSQGVWVALGNGDGTFASPANYGSAGCPAGVAAADFDGDGKIDLVVTDASNEQVAVLLGNGDGSFQTQQNYWTNGYAVSIAVADLDRDGHPDIAVANQGPLSSNGAGVAILINTGNGTFKTPVTYGAGQNYSQLSLDDLNGDGNIDVLIVPVGT